MALSSKAGSFIRAHVSERFSAVCAHIARTFSSSNAHPPALSTNMADPRCGAIAFAAELMAGRHLTWAELGACRASTVGIGTRRFVFKLSASPVIRAKS